MLRQALDLTRSLARCFTDRRQPEWVDHSLEELLAQRIDTLALGYEDLNDHDTLRLDPLLAVAADKVDPLGENRLQDKGVALAAPNKDTRYHKLSHDPRQIQQLLLKLTLSFLPRQAEEIVLDLDAMGRRKDLGAKDSAPSDL